MTTFTKLEKEMYKLALDLVDLKVKHDHAKAKFGTAPEEYNQEANEILAHAKKKGYSKELGMQYQVYMSQVNKAATTFKKALVIKNLSTKLEAM